MTRESGTWVHNRVGRVRKQKKGGERRYSTRHDTRQHESEHTEENRNRACPSKALKTLLNPKPMRFSRGFAVDMGSGAAPTVAEQGRGGGGGAARLPSGLYKRLVAVPPLLSEPNPPKSAVWRPGHRHPVCMQPAPQEEDSTTPRAQSPPLPEPCAPYHG